MPNENLTLSEQVAVILDQVRKKGDPALQFYAKKFDGIRLSPKNFSIPQKELKKAYDRISPAIRDALNLAKKRIEFFHKQEFRQMRLNWTIRLDGIQAGQIARPLDSAGLYVPGGRYCYPSTVLMTAIPAKVAGVKKIVLVSPKKNLKDEILAAAYLCSVDQVFCIGGPSAIGALAFGTKTIPKVQKIVGPGNQYVTEAKRQVFGQVGIDGLAGPSEIVIWADDFSDSEKLLLNLLAQAEHDPQAMSILLTRSAAVIKRIQPGIPPNFIKQISFELQKSDERIIQRINQIAPEHLYLAVRNPYRILPKIRCAGAIFMGENTPVPLGDYAAGPSHVLPTGGSAQFGSGLSVKDFLRWSSVIETISSKSVKTFNAAAVLAEVEGLKYHALAAKASIVHGQ